MEKLQFLSVVTVSSSTFYKQRNSYIIQAELVHWNSEDVVEAAQRLSPQQLHKHTHFLW